MSKPRKRRRLARALARSRDWIEDAGRAALAGLWSLVVRVVWMVLAAAGTIVAGAGRWVARQRRADQLLMAAAAAVLVAVVWVHGARHPDTDAGSTDSDVEALARVIRSEVGVGNAQQRLHVAWATRNLAVHRGESIAEMACTPCGPQDGTRPVSTRQAATDKDRALARFVLGAPAWADPTGGARHFINPRLQDELARSGTVPGYAGKPYRRVKRRWKQVYGWTLYYRLGPELEFWGPKRPAHPGHP
jgi:hypothetical protein